MECPKCKRATLVAETREKVVRRRFCSHCQLRFITVEVLLEEVPAKLIPERFVGKASRSDQLNWDGRSLRQRRKPLIDLPPRPKGEQRPWIFEAAEVMADRQIDTRRRIEDLREARALREETEDLW